ncbi:replicative DNA helicase [Metapseudomonas furukawaii]|uniref:replicative DNA helicase n=1 Tax=Metapseudomonas furukawaii TaxID=1149133 RepID=UPI004045380B
MREPYSIEAEHGLLGAMMQRPELIDTLSDGLAPSDFYFENNSAVMRAILELHRKGDGIDFMTVGEHLGELDDGTMALGYTGEIVRNTPSAANASTYARIVAERAMDRALLRCAERAHEIACSDQDAADKVAAVQAEVLALDNGATSDDIVMASDVVVEQVEVWQERHDRYTRGETLMGLSTGLSDLDEKIGGLQEEQLIIVAGRPAMGKTTLAMGFAENAAIRQHKSVLVFSLEMPKGQLIDRLTASVGRIPLQLIKNGTAAQEYGAELGSAARTIQHAKLALSDRASLTMNRIRSMARRHKMRHGLDLIVIDYLQLLLTDSGNGNRTEDVGAMTRHAKLLARELKVPVVMLSQLSRQCEQRPNKRPLPSDLRDSGSIEQDADIILFVYRDEVYHPETEYKGVAEIIIGKGRDVETGTVRAAFRGEINRFENLAPEWREPAPEQAKVASLASRYQDRKGGQRHG